MNEFLAELYDTRETIGADGGGSDVEKLAEAQILDQVFEAEGIDVNTIPDETIVKVAHELFGENSALVKMAEEEGEESEEESEEESDDSEEEGEDKVAQADFLGRVMAHSFVNERAEIEKNAGLADMGAKALKALKGAGKAVKGAPGAAGKAAKGKGKAMKKSYMGRGSKNPTGGKLEGLKRLGKEHKKTVGGAAAGAAGLAGLGGYAAMKKSSSALDSLAEQRALELLKEAGYEPETETVEQDKLAAAVDARAYEMLAEAGYLEE